MESNNSLITERKLWDSLGNYCHLSMYHTGQNVFELYTHEFNDAAPAKFVGGLGELNARADRWLESKKQDGFVEQLPSYNPYIHA